VSGKPRRHGGNPFGEALDYFAQFAQLPFDFEKSSIHYGITAIGLNEREQLRASEV
jgi:hypothetical protein